MTIAQSAVVVLERVQIVIGRARALPKKEAFRRLIAAALDLRAIIQFSVLAIYFLLRALSDDSLWFVDVLSYVLPWAFAPLVVLILAALMRRSRLLRRLVPVSTALFVITYGHVLLPRIEARTVRPVFTAMTYNVFYRNPKVDRAAAVIQEHAPDIVGMQESVPRVVEPLVARLADDYPYRRTERWCSFFSRYPIIEYQTVRLGSGDDLGLCSQQLVIDVAGQPVTVFNVHVRPPALSPLVSLASLLRVPPHLVNVGRDVDVRDLLSRIEQLEGPVIVLGDFNMSDQHVVYRQLTQVLRDAYRDRGRGLGFTVNSFRAAGPSLWRVDYVFHSPDLTAVQAVVGRNGGSDHRPVIVKLHL
jgi:endonuclease/exonuclease/phosphatase (EEP) superfamily protein YafD